MKLNSYEKYRQTISWFSGETVAHIFDRIIKKEDHPKVFGRSSFFV